MKVNTPIAKDYNFFLGRFLFILKVIMDLKTGFFIIQHLLLDGSSLNKGTDYVLSWESK